jgi:UDP-glucose 4-epimerase
MPRIIVTGGAGYIGSHTIIELLDKTDFGVVSVDNFSNSTAETYKRIAQINPRPFERVDVDLCDWEKLSAALASFNDIAAVIHFAAFKSVPDSMADPLLYYHNNIRSLTNLLAICKQKRIAHFIFSSSCSVYGNAKEQPVTEQTPLSKAESAYGHTKQVGEDILSFFVKAEPWFKTVVLRYFNPVGAHPSGKNGELPIAPPTNLLPIITQTAVGKNSLTVFGNDYDTRDGSCIRDYVHVSDIAEAHVLAVRFLQENKQAGGTSVFNLGTGNGVTVLEVIRSFEKVSGKKLPYKIGPRREGDVIAIYANNRLAREKLNWNPRYDLDAMTSSAWKWQQLLDSRT